MSWRGPLRIGFLGGTFDPPHEGHLRLARLAQARLGLERVLLAPVGVQPLKAGEPATASWPQRLRMVELAVAGSPGLEASVVDGPRENEPREDGPLQDGPLQDGPRGNGRPNYSVETMARVAEEYPGAQLFFLMGVDAFAGLRRWRDPVGLLQLCDLAVASRPAMARAGTAMPRDGNALLEWMPEGTRFLGMEEMAGSAMGGDLADGGRVVRVGTSMGGAGMTGAETAGGASMAMVFLVGSALVRVALLEDLAEEIAATDLRDALGRGEGYGWLPGGVDGGVARYIREQGLYGALEDGR